MYAKNKKGFTLIELLIVIAIIGILAVAFLPSLMSAPARGRDTQRIATVQKLTNYVVTKSLSNQIGSPTDTPSACIASGDTSLGDMILDGDLGNFGGVFPADPEAGFTANIGSWTCDSQYLFLNMGTDHTYRAAIVSRVELEENANIECANVSETTDRVPEAPAYADETDYCYISLIE